MSQCRQCKGEFTNEQLRRRCKGIAPALLGLKLPGLGIFAMGAAREGIWCFCGMVLLIFFFGSTMGWLNLILVGYTVIFARQHARCPACNGWVMMQAPTAVQESPPAPTPPT